MEEYLSHILSQIITPQDLRRLPESSLPEVCQALRAFIIDQVSVHPGHFASSLGAVELTVALHYVYDTPEDRIVWDVGHQAYAHKILTGRRERFETLRQKGGLSGFPTPAESPYDTFSAGHASNSISAALGMAVAAKLEHRDRKVIAVIGDAAISGGLAFEGLNNASSVPNDLLIVLNDNQMAIDPNTGALYHYLVRITTSARYNQLRYKAYKTLKRFSLMRDSMRRALIRFNNSVKSLFARRQNIFEGLDIRYFGPVDGHDVVSLVHILRQLKGMHGPKMLHLCTVKGKGYAPAEQAATIWHAPGRFNKETGERLSEEAEGMPPKYQDVFGQTLVELAEQDERIVGITPAMPTGCSMTYMMKAFPHRSFDVGIAEEHAVTFSGGLAKEGLVPVCNIYSSFMQRAVDEVIHDVALMHLHVVFCLDRAGLVGADGVTHHGLYDVAFFRTIPGMIVASPMDEIGLRHLLWTAIHDVEGPIVIRYPRGRGEHRDWQCVMKSLPIGLGRCVDDGTEGGTLPEETVRTAVLSFGPVGNNVTRALALARARRTEPEGFAHYDMIFAKPLDTQILDDVSRRCTRIITVEDGVLAGGFGSAVTEYLTEKGYRGNIERIGVPDRFILHGTVGELQAECGMDAESIARALLRQKPEA
jgi:1-deoxy-D-xylulose-5-phosphate synthase